MGLRRVVTFGVDREGGEGRDLSSERRIGSVIGEKFIDYSYGKPTLLCSVWTRKSYNPNRRGGPRNDLGRLTMVFLEKSNYFYRLLESIERRKIKLIISPFWIKVGPCPPEYERKDLMHAIGSTFGGVSRSESKGDFC
ncbi:hypothetical protein Goshw_021975 [Gossypium schwendimanii]|uniref:Uncharacterized protein n=1 Tax=Gossypium schwendimanii TaxID=34291 RepID=A0A7J9LBP7_GOSSC|nr:hypothetical protein [Gossypium schwendimanii]